MEGSVFEYEVGPPDGVNKNVTDLHDKLDEDDKLARRRIPLRAEASPPGTAEPSRRTLSILNRHQFMRNHWNRSYTRTRQHQIQPRRSLFTTPTMTVVVFPRSSILCHNALPYSIRTRTSPSRRNYYSQLCSSKYHSISSTKRMNCIAGVCILLTIRHSCRSQRT